MLRHFVTCDQFCKVRISSEFCLSQLTWIFFAAPMKPDCSSSLRYQMWSWVWYFASYLLSVIFCHSISNGFSVQFSYLISDSELDISNIHTIRTGGGSLLAVSLSKHLADHFVPLMSYCNKTTNKHGFSKYILKWSPFICSFMKPYYCQLRCYSCGNEKVESIQLQISRTKVYNKETFISNINKEFYVWQYIDMKVFIIWVRKLF